MQNISSFKRCTNTRFFLIFEILILSFSFCSCKKYVSISPPLNRLVTASVFTDNKTATAAMLGVYAQMSNQSQLGYTVALLGGLSADEFNNFSTSQPLIQYYQNALSPLTEGYVDDIWAPGYNYIYQVNAILEGIANNTSLDSRVVRQLQGEAKFTRALWYFYLTNFFGDIPLINSINYSTNSLLSRSSKIDIYKQIISDLLDAKISLNDNYVDATDTVATSERVRPNKYAAEALLARVYLYSGDYANALLESSAVISASKYSLVSDLNQVFLKNSNEAIWQLPPVESGYNTVEGGAFILTGVPPLGVRSNCTSISSNLLSSFETGDKRRDNWIGVYIDSSSTPGVSYYFPYKYKVQYGSPINEYSMMLRLSEQYLIRAEARIKSGDLAGSADLNIVRARAGLPPSTLTNRDDLLSAIMHERQVELFAEGGHRWFDLVRTNTANLIMPNVTKLKGGVWNTNYQLYPIPEVERINDPNLTQNPGY